MTHAHLRWKGSAELRLIIEALLFTPHAIFSIKTEVRQLHPLFNHPTVKRTMPFINQTTEKNCEKKAHCFKIIF